jgi:hypothetical protein
VLYRSEKHCPRCQTTLPIKEFGRNRSRADGRADECIQCRRELNRRRKPRTRLELA